MSNRRDLLKLFGLASFATVAPIAAVAIASKRELPSIGATMVYRGAGPWGSGKGEYLLASEIDSNFYNLSQAIEELRK